MNRKRDLDNLSLLYESEYNTTMSADSKEYLTSPDRSFNLRNVTGKQKKAINALVRRGFEIHKEYTKREQREGHNNIILVKSEAAIKNRHSDLIPVGVDENGFIDGQDFKTYIQQNLEEGNVTLNQPGIVQRNQDTEDENPLINDLDEEEFKKGDNVYFLNTPSNLKDIKSGMAQFPAPKFTRGKIVHIQDGVAFVDQGVGMHVVPIEDLKRDEEAENVSRVDDSRDEEDYDNPETGKSGVTQEVGANAQDPDWGSDAMKGGENEPGASIMGLTNPTSEGPSAHQGGNIDVSGDDPNEEEEADKAQLPYGKIDVNRMPEPDLIPITKVKVGNVVYKLEGPTSDEEDYDDPYYNREEDLRSRGIDPNAEDPYADEKGKAEHDERSRDITGKDEEEDEMDLEQAIKVINKHLKARVHGDESHAGEEVRKAKKAYIKNFVKKRKEDNKDEDELGQAMAYKKITGNEVKKESFNSHGDRDMTILAENYLNIKNHE